MHRAGCFLPRSIGSVADRASSRRPCLLCGCCLAGDDSWTLGAGSLFICLQTAGGTSGFRGGLFQRGFAELRSWYRTASAPYTITHGTWRVRWNGLISLLTMSCFSFGSVHSSSCLFDFSRCRFSDIFAQKGLRILLGALLALGSSFLARTVFGLSVDENMHSGALAVLGFAAIVWVAIICYARITMLSDWFVDRQIFRRADYQRGL
jgi:hypothetical protein